MGAGLWLWSIVVAIALAFDNSASRMASAGSGECDVASGECASIEGGSGNVDRSEYEIKVRVEDFVGPRTEGQTSLLNEGVGDDEYDEYDEDDEEDEFLGTPTPAPVLEVIVFLNGASDGGVNVSLSAAECASDEPFGRILSRHVASAAGGDDDYCGRFAQPHVRCVAYLVLCHHVSRKASSRFPTQSECPTRERRAGRLPRDLRLRCGRARL